MNTRYQRGNCPGKEIFHEIQRNDLYPPRHRRPAGTVQTAGRQGADAPDGDALIQVYYEQSRAFADYTTASQLANIHYTCDTRDAYWKAEQDFFEPTALP